MEERDIEKLRRERQKAENKSDFKKAADYANALGAQLSEAGRYEEAIEEHNRELFLCETTDDRIGVAVAHRKIGECYSDQGKFEQALNYEKKYLQISQKQGNLQEIQRALATLGRTYLCQAEAQEDPRAMRQSLSKARKAFIQSLDACEKLAREISASEMADMKARLCLNMGLICDKQYKISKSIECFSRGASLAAEHKVHDIVLRCRKCLAGSYQKCNKSSQAIKEYDSALKLAESVKDRLSQAEILSQKAVIYFQLKDVFAAKRSIKKAYKLKAGGEYDQEKVALVFKRIIFMERQLEELQKIPGEDHEDRMSIYERLGDNAAELENYHQAVDFYKEMLECALADGKAGRELEKIYESIASTYHDAANFAEAIEYYRKKLECVEEDKEKYVKTYISMADTMEISGETYSNVEDMYLKALDHAKSTDDAKLQARILRGLSAVQLYYKQIDCKDETDERLRILQAEHDIESEDEMSEARESQDVMDDLEDINLDDLISDDDNTDDEEYDRSNAVTAAGRVARRKARNQFKRNEKGEYPLHTACIDGALEKAKALIAQGHPINPRDHCGWIPLHEAANHNYVELVGLLLENGAWINDRGGRLCQGVTPLHDACGNGCVDVVDFLVAKGANVHAKNDEGDTALSCLVQFRKSGHTLTREEVLRVKRTEDLLKDTMKGNNPHLSLSLTSRANNSASNVLELDDDLPTIRHRQRNKVDRKRSSTPPVNNSRDSSPLPSDNENLEESVIREYEENQEKASRRRASNSLSGKRRRESLDDGEDDFGGEAVCHTSTQLNSSRNRHKEDTSGKDMYQETIASMRRSAVSSNHSSTFTRRSKGRSGSGAALVTDDDYVGDDWLIDDMGEQRKPAKRKKTEVDSIIHTTGTRRTSGGGSGGSKRRSTGISSDEEEEHVSPIQNSNTNSYKTQQRKSLETEDSQRLDPEDDNGSNDIDPLADNSEDEVMLIDEGGNNYGGDEYMMDNIPSPEMNDVCSQEFELPPVPYTVPKSQITQPGPQTTRNSLPSSASSFRSTSGSVRPHQTKLTTFGVTKTRAPLSSQPRIHQTQTVAPPSQELIRAMRLKVRIKDKCILVPVTKPDEPISWLIDEVADRHFKLYGMRPVLSLATRDGAVLSPEDPISLLLSNDEVVEGLVESWDLPPLPERYKDACTTMKSDMYQNIKGILRESTTTDCLALNDLALRPAQFSPICKALQCQNSLKEVNVKGNRLGDNGFSALCKILHTLPNLRVLNVALNQISAVGLKTLSEVAKQPDTPLQVLEKLDLSFNPLGDATTQTLAVIIEQFKSLVGLRLRACDLTLKFFNTHRIQLAEAMQKSSIHELDISYNRITSTGLELLLKSVRIATLSRLDITGVSGSYTSNNVTKHLQAFMLHKECGLGSLFLDSCCIHQEIWPELVSIVSQCPSLEKLSLAANPKIDNNDVQELLEAASRSDTSKLSSLILDGCNIRSPISTDLLDGINDKLNHNYPLQHLQFTSKFINDCDKDALRDIWEARWSDQAIVDTSRRKIVLSTATLDDQLLM